MDWDQGKTTIYSLLVNSFRFFFVNKQQYKIDISTNLL